MTADLSCIFSLSVMKEISLKLDITFRFKHVFICPYASPPSPMLECKLSPAFVHCSWHIIGMSKIQ